MKAPEVSSPPPPHSTYTRIAIYVMLLQIMPAGAPAQPSTDPSPFANRPDQSDCRSVNFVLWPNFPVATGGPVRILNARFPSDVSTSVTNETAMLPSGSATICGAAAACARANEYLLSVCRYAGGEDSAGGETRCRFARWLVNLAPGIPAFAIVRRDDALD